MRELYNGDRRALDNRMRGTLSFDFIQLIDMPKRGVIKDSLYWELRNRVDSIRYILELRLNTEEPHAQSRRSH